MFFNCIELMLHTMLLGIETQTVVGLRLKKIADGGPAATAEVQRMVTEKMTALAEAALALSGGGSCRSVVCRLRTHVQANELRLLGAAAN